MCKSLYRTILETGLQHIRRRVFPAHRLAQKSGLSLENASVRSEMIWEHHPDNARPFKEQIHGPYHAQQYRAPAN